MLAFVVNAIKQGLSFNFMCSTAAVVDIFTLVPVVGIYFGMPRIWITLKYLRINRALVAYTSLEKTGFVAQTLDELTRAFVVIGLKTLSLTVTMAGTMYVWETLGEPDFLYSTSTPTAMGDVSFIQLLYWIFTTISTVGYGDFSPQTNLSRVTIIVFIVVGVAFFSVETAALLDTMADLDSGKGKYNGKGKHIVVVGGGVRAFSPTTQRFITEVMIHPAVTGQ